MIDALRHRLAQHGQGRVMIPGWPEDAGPRQLHGTIAHPANRTVSQDEGSGGIEGS